MTTWFIAKSLLKFLQQKEDLETHRVLKGLALHKTQTTLPANLRKPTHNPAELFSKASDKSLPTVAPSEKPNPVKTHTLSIYDRLVEKVKKACPELRIKEHFDIKQAGIPDCDVIILTGKIVPDVYQSLAKAIDKQLALTEVVMMESALMKDLLSKSFKLILATPAVKQMPGFLSQIKITGKNKAYLGSSSLIFLDDADTLSTNPSLKQALWQTIKAQLVL